MKKYFSILPLICVSNYLVAQTNTFPSSGNVGIGTLSPGAKVSFTNVDATSNADGITWHNPDPTGYGIYRTPGSWTGPNYQQLKLQWHTGITLEPGSAYGKSFVEILGGGLRVSSGGVGIGVNAPTQALDVVGRVKFRSSSSSGSSSGIWFTDAAGTETAFLGQTGGTSAYPLGMWHTGSWRLVVDQFGNAGVGTTAPEAKFTISQVGNGWNDGLRINRDASNYLTLTEDMTDIRLKNWGSGGILFFTSAVEALRISNSGNVGIGTPSPSARFNIQQANGNWNGGIRLSLAGKNWDIVADTGGDRLLIAKDQSVTNGIVIHNGNVGIGVLAPNQKLTVNGTIYGKEVKVDLSVPGPDYVFEKDYDLPSLEEIKKYIDENKRLPEVPSAKEMEMNGIEIGKMNLLLLKKVEELTLYMIEAKREIEKLRSENKELKEIICPKK